MFLEYVFGSRYASYRPYFHGIQLYCLFVITLVISLAAYVVDDVDQNCDQSFSQRVKALRHKYAVTQRSSDA